MLVNALKNNKYDKSIGYNILKILKSDIFKFKFLFKRHHNFLIKRSSYRNYGIMISKKKCKVHLIFNYVHYKL